MLNYQRVLGGCSSSEETGYFVALNNDDVKDDISTCGV